MAQITYRGNLANKDFPLISRAKSQTVIVGRFDQNYKLDIDEVQRLQREKQIPECYYAHNVVPTADGYRSIKYITAIAAMSALNIFDQCFVLRDPSENKFLFSPSNGFNYVYDNNVGAWASVSPFAFGNGLVTVAYVAGETYIYYEKVGCVRYDRATALMVNVPLVGLVAANINGICSSQGFLLAWDDNNVVYRSQAAAPLTFTPDPALGSGAGVPEQIKGKIVCLLPIAGGYIVYTTANAVAAIFQQNIRYPFIYREVAGSAGIADPEQVSWQDNLGEHYVLSRVGIQKVDKSRATPVYPEVGMFLAAKIFEDYDDTTDTFSYEKLADFLDAHITVIGSKYLVISYGKTTDTEFTHAIVYDFALKRMGKFKVNHVDCFQYAKPNTVGNPTVETIERLIAFIGINGLVKLVNFTRDTTDHTGVIVLGKYQFTGERWIELEELELEEVDSTESKFSLRILESVDGKNISRVVKDPTRLTFTDTFVRFGTHGVQGKNLSIVGVGTFYLSSMQMTFTLGGRR